MMLCIWNITLAVPLKTECSIIIGPRSSIQIYSMRIEILIYKNFAHDYTLLLMVCILIHNSKNYGYNPNVYQLVNN